MPNKNFNINVSIQDNSNIHGTFIYKHQLKGVYPLSIPYAPFTVIVRYG